MSDRNDCQSNRESLKDQDPEIQNSTTATLHHPTTGKDINGRAYQQDSDGDGDGSDASDPSDSDNQSSNASTPIMEKLPLPPPPRPNKASSEDSTCQSHLGLDKNASISSSSSSPNPSRPPYIRGADTSPASSFNRIPGTQSNDPVVSPATSRWKSPTDSNGKAKRKWLYLGADIERWREHDRDNMGLSNKLAWNKGASSAVFPMVRSEGDLNDWEYDDDSGSESDSAEEISDEDFDDNDQALDSDSASEDEVPIKRLSKLDPSASTSTPSSVDVDSSRHLFGSIKDKEKARDRLPSLGLSDFEGTYSPPNASKSTSRRSSKGAAHHRSSRSRRQSQASNSSRGSRRERRFSTNGPEAAVHRHGTVIGLHTPRRDSTSSARSSASGSGRITPLLDRLGMGISPLSQIPPFQPQSDDHQPPSQPPSGGSSKVLPPSKVISHSDPTLKTDEDPPVQIDFEDEDEDEEIDKHFESQGDKIDRTSNQHAGQTRSGKGNLQQQIPPTSKTSRSSSPGSTSSSASRQGIRKKSSSVILAEAAAAAAQAVASASSTTVTPPDRDSFGIDPNGDALKNAIAQEGLTSISNAASSAGLRTSASPSAFIATESPALKLARRRRPIKVEGTLYDKSGPFREGAVTDGLSVRLFSTEGAEIGPNGSNPRNGTASNPHRRSHPDIPPTTYLITTPDNRVASAAKLRRWAMDSSGRFYAAMEIKSIEAKLKNVDPEIALGSSLPGGSKGLMKELKSTYLEDILDEVQKAETLNPKRKGNVVAHVLKTEDGKYIRLEEDYPEEAFFVVAGCEEEELAPVVKLIFTMAIRALNSFHRSGWAHGDVKLENLMFDSNTEIVVIDYENANPYCNNHGVAASTGHNHPSTHSVSDSNEDPDGYIQLVSYDWTPPEAAIGPLGRRMGPSGDLFALGCNLIRAFALRDGIDDSVIRESLLGTGQDAFFAFRDSLIKSPRSGFPKAEDVDLSLIPGLGEHEKNGEHSDFRKASDSNYDALGLHGNGYSNSHHDTTPTEGYFKPLDPIGELDSQTPSASTFSNPTFSNPQTASSSSSSISSLNSSIKSSSSNSINHLPSPSRILQRFAAQAPKLLQYVLARCVTSRVVERSLSSGAELEGLELAKRMEIEEKHDLEIGRSAVEKAIELSGSSWVRPKLDEARASLGLE